MAIAAETQHPRPLLVLEPLRADYPWASARLHRFVLDGMADQARAFEDTGALYYPYVEPRKGAGKGLLEALASRPCSVATDDYPAFFLPRMLQAAARKPAVGNHPDRAATSGLWPYLHFGHLSAHEVLEAIAAQEGWSPERLAPTRDDYDRYGSLPERARQTLDAHRRDRRPHYQAITPLQARSCSAGNAWPRWECPWHRTDKSWPSEPAAVPGLFSSSG